MTIRIKARVRSVAVKQKNDNTYVAEIELVQGGIAVWNESNKKIIPVDSSNHHFRINDDPNDNIQPDTLEKIKFHYEHREGAERVARLIYLKSLICGDDKFGKAENGGVRKGEWWINTQKLKYDGSDTGTNYFDDLEGCGRIKAGHAKLTLGEKSWTSSVEYEEMINLDDEEWVDGQDPNNVERFSYKQIANNYVGLLQLHLRVNEVLKGEKDIDETELNGWLAKLREYANPNNTLKNTVYTADYGAGLGNKYFEVRGKVGYKLLCELKVWKACGFNNIKEILKANANGIKIVRERISRKVGYGWVNSKISSTIKQKREKNKVWS